MYDNEGCEGDDGTRQRVPSKNPEWKKPLVALNANDSKKIYGGDNDVGTTTEFGAFALESPLPNDEASADDKGPDFELSGFPWMKILTCVGLFLGMLFLSALTVLDYYTDVTVLMEIRDTKKSFERDRALVSEAKSAAGNLTQGLCSSTTPSPFASETECQCEDISCSCDGSLCNEYFNTSSNQLLNLDSDLSTSALCSNPSDVAQCHVCLCPGMTPYFSDAPSVQYLEAQYNNLSETVSKTLCKPFDTAEVANKGKCAGCKDIKYTLSSTYVAAWFFVVIPAVPTLILLVSNTQDRVDKLWRYCRGSWDIFTPDEKTWLFWLCSMTILVSMLEDIPQTVIGLIYLMSRFANHGSDCVANFVKQPLQLHDLTLDRSKNTIWGLLEKNQTVALSVLSTLMNVGVMGFMMLRVLVWYLTVKRSSQMDHAKRTVVIVFGLICGTIFILIIMTPYWGVLYNDGAEFLNMEHAQDVWMYLFFIGLGFWTCFCFSWCCVCCAVMSADGDAGDCECDCC